MASRAESRAGSAVICGIVSIMASVTIAIAASAPRISALRLKRSAQTPPMKEIRNCGR